MCKEKDIYLTDNAKKIKPQNLNKGKFHLNQEGSRLLKDILLKENSHVSNWQIRTKNSDSEEWISNLTLTGLKIIDCKSTLKTIREDNLNKLTFAHLTINSIWNKFDKIMSQVKDAVDNLIISETKIYDSLPIANFLINGFSQPYRIYQNSSDGVIMLYVREDIPSNLLKIESIPIEGFYVELKLWSENWLINCSYK